MKNILLLLLFVIISGCGEDKKKDSVLSNVLPPEPGIYESCEYDSDSDVSEHSTIYFNPPSIIEKLVYRSGQGCSGADLYTEKWIYVTSNVDTQYTVGVVGLVMMPMDSSVTSTLNTDGYCGYTNWADNQPKNILGRNCDGTTFSYGTGWNMSFSRLGSSLRAVVGDQTITYNLTKGFDFSDQGDSLGNGVWALSFGSNAFYFEFQGSNYTITSYDKDTLSYYAETGTYVSNSNNEVELTIGSYSPDCDTDEGSTYKMKFVKTYQSLALQLPDGTEILAEAIPYAESLFRSAYLPGTYSAGCF